MKYIFLSAFLLGGIVLNNYSQTQTEGTTTFVTSDSLKRKTPSPQVNETPNTNTADPILIGATTTISVDRYGNRTVVQHEAVTVGERRTELNGRLESLRAKLFTANQEEPGNTTRINELEQLIATTEQELNSLPQ